MWPFTENCDSCGESIWRNSRRCAYCGSTRGAGVVAPGVRPSQRIIPAGVKCPDCGQPLGTAQNFCPRCGAGAATGTRRCTDVNCGAFSPGDAKYCVACGRPLGESEKPALRGETGWARDSADLMARIEVRDLEGTLRKGVVIEHGTEALFLADGRLTGPLEPGRHDLGGLLKRFKNLQLRYEGTAIVYDTAQFSLQFRDVKALTKENVEVLVDCELRLHVRDASALFTNLMKGATQFRRAALQEFLAPEVANGLAEAIRPHGVQEFRESFALKADFDRTLASHLATTLAHSGLVLAYLRTLNYRQEKLDAQSRRIAEYFFEACDITLQGEGRRKVIDATAGSEASMAEGLRGRLEPRLALLEVLRNLQAADLENTNILAELRQKYDMAQVSRDMGFDQFIEQAKSNRDQALRMLREGLDQSYRKLTASNEIEMARLAGAKRIVEAELEQQQIRTAFDADLDRQRHAFEFEMQKGRASQELLARTLQVQRDDELTRARTHMEIRVGEAQGLAQVMTSMRDVAPEVILAIKSPADFARVLEARAGRALVQEFLGAQLAQQQAFLHAIQEQARVAMTEQANVAAKAAERPTAVVYGPSMSPTQIAPSQGSTRGRGAPEPSAWCPSCKADQSYPPDARCPKCGSVLVARPPGAGQAGATSSA